MSILRQLSDAVPIHPAHASAANAAWSRRFHGDEPGQAAATRIEPSRTMQAAGESDQKSRITAILALPEARGREATAIELATGGASVETAREILGMVRSKADISAAVLNPARADFEQGRERMRAAFAKRPPSADFEAGRARAQAILSTKPETPDFEAGRERARALRRKP